MNIKYYISTIIMISSFNLFGQQSFKGQFIDSKSKQPIPWVNIGLIGKNIGTVSNEKGDFILEFSKNQNSDTLRISMIGYKDLLFNVRDFKNRILKNAIFQLTEETIQLDEVVISSKEMKEFVLGNTSITNTTVFGFQSNKLGNEIGTIIKIEDGPIYIKKVNINIYKNNLNRFNFRLNIYNLKDGIPYKTILNENIIVECKKNKGLFTVDLSDYNIVVDEDIFISMEWIENLTHKDLYFSTSPEGSQTFTRHASQANWVGIENNSLGLNISVKY